MEVKHLTKAEFLSRVYDYEASPSKFESKGDKPVLVDFYASWCGPCKMMAPVLEEIAGEYEGKIDVYKVDVDDERELAARFNVRSIPALLFVPKGGMPQMIAGAMPKDALRAKIDGCCFDRGGAFGVSGADRMEGPLPVFCVRSVGGPGPPPPDVSF